MISLPQHSKFICEDLIDLISEGHESQLVDTLFYYHKNDLKLFLTLQREILTWVHTSESPRKSQYLALSSLRAAKAPNLKVAGSILLKDLANSQEWYDNRKGPNIDNLVNNSPYLRVYCRDNPSAVECKIFDL